MIPGNSLSTRPCASLLAFVMLFGFCVHPSVCSQDGINPSDIWYRGFLLVQGAQEDEANGNYLGALNRLTEAKPLYEFMTQQFPDFQPEIVTERRRIIDEKRDELKTRIRALEARSSRLELGWLNAVFLVLAGWLFVRVMSKAREKGLLTKFISQ